MSKAKLVLASSSPRRLDLLKQIGVIPDIVKAAEIDESQLKKELPSVYVKRISNLKAAEIAPLYPDAFILGADTIVTKGRKILHKAQNDAEVQAHLQDLSGCSHKVITSVCLVHPDGKISSRTSATHVKFKKLSEMEIASYAKSKEGIGKAGGYAAQGIAGAFLRSINGSYSAIVGLPLFETKNLLMQVSG